MTPEAECKKYVKQLLAKYKIWYFMPSMSGFGRAGIPDFICCIRGRLLGIETKALKGKLTRIQEVEQGKINDAGGVCIVMRIDRLQALELLIQIMLRAPIIGTSNETVPVTEDSIVARHNKDESAPAQEGSEVVNSEQEAGPIEFGVGMMPKGFEGLPK